MEEKEKKKKGRRPKGLISRRLEERCGLPQKALNGQPYTKVPPYIIYLLKQEIQYISFSSFLSHLQSLFSTLSFQTFIDTHFDVQLWLNQYLNNYSFLHIFLQILHFKYIFNLTKFLLILHWTFFLLKSTDV